MKMFLAFCLTGLQLIVFSGCTSTAVMPTAIPDGQASYKYENGNFAIVYSGQWLANTPQGLGQAVLSYSGKPERICKGNFGVAEPTAFYGAEPAWGEGEVVFADKSTFIGTFTNNFKYGLGCEPKGTGSLTKSKWRITGNFYQTDWLTFGPCQIQKFTGEVLAGNCSAPPGASALNFYGGNVYLTAQIWENLFQLINGKATYIDPKGTRYDGSFDRSSLLNGIYTVTYKNKKPIPVLFENGKLIQENPNAKVIAQFNINDEKRKTNIALQNQAAAQRARQAEAAAEAEKPVSQNNDFQWGKLAALSSVAAIGGVGSLPAETQTNIAAGIVQDSMAGRSGTNNFTNAYVGSTMNTIATADPGLAAITNAGSRITSKPGAPAVGSSASAAAPMSDAVKAEAKACATKYVGPDNDPQTDSYCKLAAFDACLHRVTKLTTYDHEGSTACKTLRGLLESTGATGNYECSYCPYPY